MKQIGSRKFLGVDWGEKRIGLALGEEEVKLATPWKIVANLEELVQEIETEKIDVVILGEPLKIHNSQAEVIPKFQEFLQILKQRIKIEVITLDERLTSKAVKALQASVDFNQKSRKKKNQEAIDAMAAMLILQQYFDSYL